MVNHLLLARMDSRDMMTGISMDKEGTATNKGRHTEMETCSQRFYLLFFAPAAWFTSEGACSAKVIARIFMVEIGAFAEQNSLTEVTH